MVHVFFITLTQQTNNKNKNIIMHDVYVCFSFKLNLKYNIY